MSPSELEAWLAARYRRAPAPPPPLDASPSAAVAVILAGPSLELALIRRAEDARDPWSGHMALPGGRRDPADVDLVGTARRETLEEVGIELGEHDYWGPLPEVSALSGGRARGFRVAPFLFRIAERPAVRLNYEVAELLWLPIGELLAGGREVDFDYVRDGLVHRFPAWDVGGRVVWGLTHRILSLLLELPERPIVTLARTL